MKKFDVAVVGATGVVGEKMLEVLDQRDFPVGDVYVLASHRSAGKEISFKGKTLVVEELTDKSFEGRGIDFALFSAGSSVSLEFAPIAAANGVIVIDNSSAWRMDEGVPLVVPEVNPEAAFTHKNLIANPNCSTIQAVVALKPIYDTFGIERIIFSTYQSVSGSGIAGIRDLEAGIQGKENTFYPKQIAYNVLPHIDTFQENGYTKEEMKMVNETRKILGDQALRITSTTVRVPVMFAHSEAVNVETKKPFELEEVFACLGQGESIVVMDDVDNGVYPTAHEAAGTDLVYVGRIRRDFSTENALNMWVVADNLRKGAATNAVQIAELLASRMQD
ncbi:MAG: aspartate-semialdehyde dehydrogenase [Eubacteriaceae bacterium]|nr:aspartate-semialdehyde dehydrogenase [Eubacteriaceae bacterium]